MKAFYLTISIILTVLILLVAFGNIGAICNQTKFLFYEIRWSPTVLILFVAVLGMITGAFYHAFLSKILSEDEEEETQEF